MDVDLLDARPRLLALQLGRGAHQQVRDVRLRLGPGRWAAIVLVILAHKHKAHAAAVPGHDAQPLHLCRELLARDGHVEAGDGGAVAQDVVAQGDAGAEQRQQQFSPLHLASLSSHD